MFIKTNFVSYPHVNKAIFPRKGKEILIINSTVFFIII